MPHEDTPDATEFRVRAIGHVRTDVPDAEVPRRRRDLVSDIVVLPDYAPGLAGIEEYSQLIVLFYMHRSPHGGALQTHPRGDASLPLTGVFATRGRAHPNPIGLAVVDLLARHDCVLTVRRLDAWHGTPIIDIKPYDHYDVYPDPRVPAWFRARLTA